MVLANAIAPMVILGMLHLMCGNALLGLVEGGLLAWIWKLKVWRTIGLMVLANYLSSFAGSLLAVWLVRPNDVPLADLSRVLPVLYVVAFLATLLIEYPFVRLAFWKENEALRRSLIACGTINVASYALLAGWYAQAVNTRLVNVAFVEPSAIEWKSDPVIFYLDADRTVLVRHRPRQGFTEQVVTASPGRHIWQSERPDGVLVCEEPTPPEESRKEVNCWEAGLTGAATSVPHEETRRSRFIGDKRPASERHYRFTPDITGYAVRVHEPDGSRKEDLGVSVPLAFRGVRELTVLPGDQLVIAVRQDLCLLDYPSRRLAVIARGSHPLVLLEGFIPPPQDTGGTGNR